MYGSGGGLKGDAFIAEAPAGPTSRFEAGCPFRVPLT